jgi:hypothetical protein
MSNNLSNKRKLYNVVYNKKIDYGFNSLAAPSASCTGSISMQPTKSNSSLDKREPVVAAEPVVAVEPVVAAEPVKLVVEEVPKTSNKNRFAAFYK